MQWPAVDLVMLMLLVLFFGLQLRNRSPAYFRMWFLGWVFVLLSVAVWLVVPNGPGEARVLEMARVNLLLAGTLLFLLSFLATVEGLWAVVFRGLLIAVPAVLLFNAVEYMGVSVPIPALLLAVVAWEVYGVYAAWVLLPRAWRRARIAIRVICGVFGVSILTYLCMTGRRDDLDEWTVAEVLLCTAVLYVATATKRRLTTWVGAAGFVGWALCYLISVTMLHHPVRLALVGACWNVPKYLVAFSMILRVFEVDTEQKSKLAEEFRGMYEDFRLMYEGHPHPMWIYDVGTGAVLSVNKAAVQMYGYTEEEWLGMELGKIEVPDDAEAAAVNALVPKAEDGRRTRHCHKDGRLVWVNVNESKLSFQGRSALMVMARDITERLNLNRQLLHQAHHDVLTGLPNRALWDDRVQQCLDRSVREGRKAVLLTIDIDHFKQINDTYGHHVGDECLKEVARRLQSSVRQIDTLARVGGEEFAAIIGGLGSVADAEKIAGSLLQAFEAPVLLPDCDLKVTVSIGAAVFPEDAQDGAMLRRLSDAALYRAKGAGRNCVRFAI